MPYKGKPDTEDTEGKGSEIKIRWKTSKKDQVIQFDMKF